MKRMIVITSDRALMDKILSTLKSDDLDIGSVAEGGRGLDQLKLGGFDACIIDARREDVEAGHIIGEARRHKVTTPCIVLCNSATEGQLAVIGGAYDYMLEPAAPETVLITITRALDYSAMRSEIRSLRAAVRKRHEFSMLLGHSQVVSDLYNAVERVAGAEMNVLLIGESGTGKMTLARTIHHNSSRAECALVSADCSAVPDTLVASLLLGQESGHFQTDMVAKPGRFEMASGGTLVLTNINKLPRALQGVLLDVLQTGSFERIGGTRQISASFRVIATSREPMELMAHEGRFDSRLYDLISQAVLRVPPLRLRRDDIPLMARFFLEEACRKRSKQAIRIDETAMKMLLAHNWPGNIMELESLMDTLALLNNTGLVTAAELPESIRRSALSTVVVAEDAQISSPALHMVDLTVPESGLDYYKTMAAVERTMIEQAMKMSGGAKSKAAQLLGLNRTTLVEKIKRLFGDEDEEQKRKS